MPPLVCVVAFRPRMDPRQYPDKIKRRRGTGNRKSGNRVKVEDAQKALYLADRAAFVREQILAGKGYKLIAEELGVSISIVHQDHHACLIARKAEKVEELRAQYNARYEAIIDGHLEYAVSGNVKSAEIVLKATALAAKLNGAEMPQKLEVAGKNGGPIVLSLDEIAAARAAVEANDDLRQSVAEHTQFARPRLPTTGNRLPV